MVDLGAGKASVVADVQYYCLTCSKSADPDEMPLHAAFHQGMHCLP